TIDVSASVDTNVVSAGEIVDTTLAALPSVLGPYPGITAQRSGMSREADDVFVNRNRNLVIALLIAYALMAVTLRSYSDPLLVMVAIPFGIAGAIAAHALLGLVVSGFSMIGMVALTGVVVNDSLVLVHTAKEKSATGASNRAAMCEAAAERFRPILLTSLTTFFGLLPLLFESSSQAAWLKPIGVTLAFGVMFATGVTLLVVPAASALLEDLRGSIASAGRRTASAPEQAARSAAASSSP
ncbi:MAG: efflux RND transporter permease subunit, partial [Myxococcota bacterium]